MLPRTLIAAAVVAVSLVTRAAWAHVAFDGLKAGATFVAGSTVELKWIDVIPHDTTAYHLELILNAEAARIPIADLPATEHSYLWLVPDMACSDCSLDIVQENGGMDYTATVPISIVAYATTDAPPPAEKGCSAVGPAGSATRSEPLALAWLVGGLAWWTRRRGARSFHRERRVHVD